MAEATRQDVTDFLLSYESSVSDAATFSERVAIRSKAKDEILRLLAEAWDLGAEQFSPDFFWHDGGREMNPYAPERMNAVPREED